MHQQKTPPLKSSNLNSNALISILVVVLVSSLAFLAIQYRNFKTRQINQQQAGSTPQTSPGSFTFTQSSNELVPDFPDFPQFPQADLISSYKKTEGNEEIRVGYEAVWRVQGSVPQITQWYVDNFTKEGWTLTAPPDSPDNIAEQFLIAEKGQHSVYLTIESESDANLVQINAEFPVAG